MAGDSVAGFCAAPYWAFAATRSIFRRLEIVRSPRIGLEATADPSALRFVGMTVSGRGEVDAALALI